MPDRFQRDSLLDVFAGFSRLSDLFLVYDDGYRSRSYSYADVVGAARALAARLEREGIARGDRVIFYSENRPEWIAALWGCLLAGVIVVPVDYHASFELVARIDSIVRAKAILFGEEVELGALRPGIAAWPLAGLEWTAASGVTLAAKAAKDDIAEIIFTSGATAEPKGVTITHRNVLANIVPVEGEVRKYRSYARPFFPIRFVNLLPLSHMFGQAMATFIPPMLPGLVVFLRSFSPDEIIRQIHRRRISVLVSVPKILEVLRQYVVQLYPEAAAPPPPGEHWAKRWWRYRRIHRLFGWKFWAFIVGAAPLDPSLEEFWARLGFVVIQGYGLTETAPIVTLNHPFHTRKGAVGKPIAGVKVKIAEDGEILVRGENVTAGYVNAGGITEAFDADGWFHTGDVGYLDETGNLYVRGRKKEMIVTPEGMNIFPEDVERVLDRIPGVRESAVIGDSRAHAVLVLEPEVAAGEVVRQANALLEEHQKIREVSVWPAPALPRTEGTRKLKRGEVRRWAQSPAAGPPPAPASDTLEAIVARFAGSRAVNASTTLDELGLSSLERVELLMALEQRLETSIDERQFAAARTVGELRSRMQQAAPAEPFAFPAWNRSWFARLMRRLAHPLLIIPVVRLFAWIRVRGRENLASLQGPVIFAANHQSHIDTPVIFASLPARWRYHVAPAMSKEFFTAHFNPQRYPLGRYLVSSLQYTLSTLLFFAFPFPQREAGVRQALRYAGELASERTSILIYPEGRRTDSGEIRAFQPGVALLASRLRIPVVPVRLQGCDRVLHHSWKMARPGFVTVTFGKPLLLEGEDYAALAKQVEDAVRALAASSGNPGSAP